MDKLSLKKVWQQDHDSIFKRGGENNFLDKFNGWDSPEGFIEASDWIGLVSFGHTEDCTLEEQSPTPFMTREVEVTGEERGLYKSLGEPALDVLTPGEEAQ